MRSGIHLGNPAQIFFGVGSILFSLAAIYYAISSRKHLKNMTMGRRLLVALILALTLIPLPPLGLAMMISFPLSAILFWLSIRILLRETPAKIFIK